MPQFEQAAKNLQDRLILHRTEDDDFLTIEKFLEDFCRYIVKRTIPASGSTILQHQGKTTDEIAGTIPDMYRER